MFHLWTLLLRRCRSKRELYSQGRVLQRGVGELCSTEPRDKIPLVSLTFRTYFKHLHSVLYLVVCLNVCVACMCSLVCYELVLSSYSSRPALSVPSNHRNFIGSGCNFTKFIVRPKKF